LQPVIGDHTFDQWGLDVIGEIVPNSSKKHRYILIVTDYLTKWVEAIPLKLVTIEQVIYFIDQFIITRFGLPSTLIFVQRKLFFFFITH